MRIHSDRLNREAFEAALPAGVYIEHCTIHASRKRFLGFEVRLASHHGRRNNAAGTAKAASYDEWGDWIANLYRVDSDAVVGPYNGMSDFREKTSRRYL